MIGEILILIFYFSVPFWGPKVFGFLASKYLKHYDLI